MKQIFIEWFDSLENFSMRYEERLLEAESRLTTIKGFKKNALEKSSCKKATPKEIKQYDEEINFLEASINRTKNSKSSWNKGIKEIKREGKQAIDSYNKEIEETQKKLKSFEGA
jgi:hypothetical protein